jgi:glycosyltransferase involved in cell wall biosynthesis
MQILIALTYYRPHYSGLTIYVERLARALAAQGHQVTVLTSRYAATLPAQEKLDGVEVRRLPVAMRISKGVIMPSMPIWAARLARQADVINLHVPQLDAAMIGMLGQFMDKPILLTYHCDMRLPHGIIHSIANLASNIANHITARTAKLIVTNTQDYAENSAFLRRYLSKVRVIPPPITLSPITENDSLAFRQRAHVQPGQRIIGMAARLASEKGVEYLVEAMPIILQKHPQARVLFVGQYQDVLGEEAYAQRLAPLIEQLGEHWTFLGVLEPTEFSAFLHTAEVTVLPSINSTESFGMVQIESMISATPVVASDLPGVRQPVLESGMGRIVPPRDAAALANAIIDILDNPQDYRGEPEKIAERYSPAQIARQYEALFNELIA